MMSYWDTPFKQEGLQWEYQSSEGYRCKANQPQCSSSFTQGSKYISELLQKELLVTLLGWIERELLKDCLYTLARWNLYGKLSCLYEQRSEKLCQGQWETQDELGLHIFSVADIEPLYLSVPLFSQIKEVGEVVNWPLKFVLILSMCLRAQNSQFQNCFLGTWLHGFYLGMSWKCIWEQREVHLRIV